MSKYDRQVKGYHRNAGYSYTPSTKSIRRASHDARNDAAGSGHLHERNYNKVRDSAITKFVDSILTGGKSKRRR